MPKLNYSRAFTLVEMLIVVALIIILAGIAYTTTNPAQQRRKASQNVMRANLSKLCLALSACAAQTDEVVQCQSDVGLGVTLPNGQPEYSTYTIVTSSDLVTISATLPPGSGSSDNCIYMCSYDFSTGASVSIAEAGSGSLCVN